MVAGSLLLLAGRWFGSHQVALVTPVRRDVEWEGTREGEGEGKKEGGYEVGDEGGQAATLSNAGGGRPV